MADQAPGDLPNRTPIAGTERLHLQTASDDYSASVDALVAYAQTGMATDAEVAAAVSAHAAASDPHGDRAYAAGLVDDLSGVTDAATARTNLGLGSAATQASTAFDAAGTAASAVSAHEADTTNVHGIANTAALVLTGDARLSDARTPTAHKTSHATGGSDALSPADIGAATAGHNHDATYQPLDSDLTTIAAANNGTVLAATTASFTTADKTKLDGIEAAADVTDAANVAAAGAVMQTLVDAKGDLIVATAADTVARLPVGATNGHVLTVDSAEAAGMKWAAASGGGYTPFGSPGMLKVSGGSRQPVPGLPFYTPVGNAWTGTYDPVRNRTYYLPFMVPSDWTRQLNEIWVDVTTNVASSILSIGLYLADADWQPTGTIVQDFGTVSSATTGLKKITGLTRSFTPGQRYVFAYNHSGGASSAVFRRWQLAPTFGGLIYGTGSGESVAQIFASETLTAGAWLSTGTLYTGLANYAGNDGLYFVFATLWGNP